MRKENVVSIWVGSFKSENEFTKFIRERYNEDGDLLLSAFMKAFEISHIDNDFQEVLFQENLSKDELSQASHADTFIDKIDKLSGNSIILLYDFCYTGNVKETNNLRFFGTFNYNK